MVAGVWNQSRTQNPLLFRSQHLVTRPQGHQTHPPQVLPHPLPQIGFRRFARSLNRLHRRPRHRLVRL